MHVHVHFIVIRAQSYEPNDKEKLNGKSIPLNDLQQVVSPMKRNIAKCYCDRFSSMEFGDPNYTRIIKPGALLLFL